MAYSQWEKHGKAIVWATVLTVPIFLENSQMDKLHKHGETFQSKQEESGCRNMGIEPTKHWVTGD